MRVRAVGGRREIIGLPHPDAAQLMHCHVNRAAALLKLEQKELAVEDADMALRIAERVYAPKTRRKAYLRRAQAVSAGGWRARLT